jgi:SNF2 family DNA or RNA helicase
MTDIKQELDLQINIDNRMERFKFLINYAKFDFKQHQYDGVEWCLRNEICPNPLHNVRGGIIADEMGLGKTIMMIGLMFVNYLEHTLIVVPPILVNQWESEIYRASGHRALVYHGSKRNTITQDEFNKRPIIITTYNSLIQSKSLINTLSWNRIIFDESHHLRNNKTSKYKKCNNLKARSRWFVTGTPIQNRARDLYNLLDMLGVPSENYMKVDEMPNILETFMLRRTKKEVGIILPSVNKHQVSTHWKSEEEKNLAEEIHSFIPNQTRVSTNKSREFAKLYNNTHSIVAFQKARQICVLPRMIKSDKKAKQLFEQGYYSNIDNYDSKIETLIKLIDTRKDNGRGKIIFCQFREEIDTIVSRLQQIGLKKVVKYDGRNSGGDNLKNIGDQADALVIQIQSGNEGLNLQKHFSEVYFVSPHWNPSFEDQAIARCHRIGQKNEVDVFKLEMKEFQEAEKEEEKEITIDIYVRQTQDRKRALANKVLGSKIKQEEEKIDIVDSQKLPKLSKEDIEFEVEEELTINLSEKDECELMAKEDVNVNISV